MSALPSPLKSPSPATFQARLVTPVTDWLCENWPERHSTLAPVVLLRHRMSALPSPLKSPTPTGCQSIATLELPCAVALLADSQMVLVPELVLRQKTSALPSPLKSPLPAATQALSPMVVTVCASAELPDLQIALAPVWPWRQNRSDAPSPLKSDATAPPFLPSSPTKASARRAKFML